MKKIVQDLKIRHNYVNLNSMFHDKKYDLIPKGDYVSPDEAVMDDEWEVRSRCESAYEVVSQQIMSRS